MIRPRTKKGDLIIGLTLIAVVVAIPLWILHSCLPAPLSKDVVWHPQTIVYPPNRAEDTEFGDVAVDDNTVAITTTSSKMLNGKKKYTSAVSVYVNKNNQWTEEAQIDYTRGGIERLARGVDISGNTIAILTSGEYLSGKPSKDRGIIYLFSRQSSTWLQQAQLVFPESGEKAAYETFSGEIALDKNTLVVGGVNAAYVFERDAGTGIWVYQTKLLAPDRDDLQSSEGPCRFGSSVDVSGNSIVVGSDPITSSRISANCAHVFVRDSRHHNWVHQAKLHPDGIAESFGNAVAIDHDLIAVSAFDNTFSFINGHSGLGFAYLYRRDPQTKSWKQEARLVPQGIVSFHGFQDFGASLGLSHNHVLLGSQMSHEDSVYLFSWNKNTKQWGQQARIVTNQSGKSVAVSNSYIAVNDPSLMKEQNHQETGGFYTFSIQKPEY
jgi:hypothetical protein